MNEDALLHIVTHSAHVPHVNAKIFDNFLLVNMLGPVQKEHVQKVLLSFNLSNLQDT